MAMSNQMGGGLLSCPDRHILWLSRLTFKRQEKKEHSPAGTIPSTGNRQDLFKRTRGRLEPFLAIPKTRASSSWLGGWKRRKRLFLRMVDEVRQLAWGKMVSPVGCDNSFTVYSVGDGSPVDVQKVQSRNTWVA